MSGIYNNSAFWLDTTPSAQKTFLLAKACRFAAGGYDSTEFTRFCSQIGATIATPYALSGASPSLIIFELTSNIKIVAIYGMANWEQVFNAVVFSGAIGNSRGPGLVSTLLDAAYTPRKSLICDGLQGTTSAKTNLIYAGFSLGSFCAAAAASDAVTNFSTTCNVLGLHVFGSPRPGDQNFISSLNSINCQNTHIRGDSIAQLPPNGDGITLTDLVGGSANARQRVTEYIAIPGEMDLTANALILTRTPPSLTVIDAVRLAAGCALDGDVPQEHRLENYVNFLANISQGELRAQMRAHNAEKDALLASWFAEASEEPDEELDTPVPSGNWPDPIVREPVPTPPIGHTYTRTFQRVCAVAHNSSSTWKPGIGSNHVSAHDGHAHKAAKHILAELANVRHHDYSVYQGTSKGKQMILFDPAQMDEDMANNFYQVEQYISNRI